MRQASPELLQNSVKDFLHSIQVLPKWIESSASDKPGRGHYEWGNWSDAIRAVPMWQMGGPWRTIAADVRSLIPSAAEFHKIKDQIVWEIVEQTYNCAERARRSLAPEDTVKTRIRSVFSWQRRHDIKKNSLMWFLDFAFVHSAYAEFQAFHLFSGSPIPSQDPATMASRLSPAEFGRNTIMMEEQMINHGFLPFYSRVPGLEDRDVLIGRHVARDFCRRLTPPIVDMDTAVRETRGMPREEKAIDFMTPWLQRMSTPENEGKWNVFVCKILEEKDSVNNFELFKTEVCRASVIILLMELTKCDSPEAGYVYDIAANIAVEQSEKELLVSQRLQGQKRKRTVSRRTLRGDLELRIQRYISSSTTRTATSNEYRGTLTRFG